MLLALGITAGGTGRGCWPWPWARCGSCSAARLYLKAQPCRCCPRVMGTSGLSSVLRWRWGTSELLLMRGAGVRVCVPLPQEWGIHLSVELTHGSGHSSLSMFFGGQAPLFSHGAPMSQHPPMAVGPSHCPSTPWHPWCPAKGWLLLALSHHPLLHITAPFHPPSRVQGLPLLLLLGNSCLPPSPRKSWATAPQQWLLHCWSPRVTAVAGLWGQRWEAVTYSKGDRCW